MCQEVKFQAKIHGRILRTCFALCSYVHILKQRSNAYKMREDKNISSTKEIYSGITVRFWKVQYQQ